MLGGLEEKRLRTSVNPRFWAADVRSLKEAGTIRLFSHASLLVCEIVKPAARARALCSDA